MTPVTINGQEDPRLLKTFLRNSEGEKFQRTMEEFRKELNKLGPLELD